MDLRKVEVEQDHGGLNPGIATRMRTAPEQIIERLLAIPDDRGLAADVMLLEGTQCELFIVVVILDQKIDVTFFSVAHVLFLSQSEMKSSCFRRPFLSKCHRAD